MNRVDNKSNVKGKTLNSKAFSKELCAYVQTSKTHVPHNSDTVSFSYGVLESAVQNSPDDTTKSWQVTTNALTQVSLAEKQLESGWNELSRFARNSTTTTSVVADNAIPAQVFKTVGNSKECINPSNYRQTTTTVDFFDGRTSYAYDDQLGVLVTEEQYVAEQGVTLIPAPTQTMSMSMRQVDRKHAIVTVTSLPAAWQRESYQTIDVVWPSVLTSIVTAGKFQKQQRRTVFTVNFNIKPGYRVPTNARIVENIVTAAQKDTLLGSFPVDAPITRLGTDTTRAFLWAPRTSDLRYDGYLFNLNVSGVLCDESTVSMTTDSADTYYGASVTDSFTVPASSPTKTAFVGMAGQEVCLEDSISQYRNGWWMRRRVFVKVPAL